MAENKLPPDDDLIPRLLSGNETAFKLLVKNYNGLMIHLARAIVGDAIAEEVVQDAWIASIKALPKFERRSSLKTWILRIVTNCAKSRLRHESRTINFDDISNIPGEIPQANFKSNGHWQLAPHAWHADTPDALLSSGELKREIDKALKGLPVAQQAVVALRDMQGLNMDEICKILEISESNARVLLHRARSQIRLCIDKFLASGDK